MPFGPWKDFGSCLSAMRKKYPGKGRAERVCGALKKRLEDRRGSTNEPTKSDLGARELAQASEEEIMQLIDRKKVMTYEDNGRLFIKQFLVDGSVNYNGWGVDPESIPSRIASAIGKPIVAYVNQGWERRIEPWRRPGEFDHPVINDKDYHHAMAYQDLFRVGTYIDVVQANDGSWWGIAEVTDDGVKQALREDPDLPIFTSPSVRLFKPTIPGSPEDRNHQEWEFLHSAIVDRPAYGVKKAYISGQCSGDQETCLLQLRKASIADHGYGCGFCTYAALMKLASDTSHLASEGKSKAETNTMSSEENQQNTEEQENQTRGEEEQEAKGEGGQKGKQPQTLLERQRADAEKARKDDTKKRAEIRAKEVKADKKPEGTSDEDYERFKERRELERKQIDRDEGRDSTELLKEVKKLTAENASLRAELQKAQTDNEALNSLTATINDRLKALEDERSEAIKRQRFDEISNIVNASMAYRDSPKEVRDKQVETFFKSSMSVDQIKEHIIAPAEMNIRKASLEAGAGRGGYRSRLQIGNKGTVVDSRSASIASSDDPEDRKPRYLQFAEKFLPNGGVQYD